MPDQNLRPQRNQPRPNYTDPLQHFQPDILRLDPNYRPNLPIQSYQPYNRRYNSYYRRYRQLNRRRYLENSDEDEAQSSQQILNGTASGAQHRRSFFYRRSNSHTLTQYIVPRLGRSISRSRSPNSTQELDEDGYEWVGDPSTLDDGDTENDSLPL